MTRPHAAALLVLAALGGCASQPRPAATAACVAPAHGSMLAELLFGLSIPGGGTVDDAAFADYVATELAPRFPDGLTLLAGSGRFRPPGGAPVAEPSRVAMIDLPDDAASRARLDAARRAYRIRFHQHAVGLITTESCADF